MTRITREVYGTLNTFSFKLMIFLFVSSTGCIVAQWRQNIVLKTGTSPQAITQ